MKRLELSMGRLIPNGGTVNDYLMDEFVRENIMPVMEYGTLIDGEGWCKGDMLYMSSANRIVRIHAPFVSDSEIEKINNFIYIFIHLQFAGFVLYFVSASTNTFGNLVIIFLLLGQYGLCWTLIHLDKQNRFIYQILEWSNKMSNDLNQVNDLVIGSDTYLVDKTSFNEDQYAKLWLKEMSTSMDMPWKSILIEFLPGDTIFVPKVRVSLGGIRKSIQNASAYGFSSGGEGEGWVLG